VNILNKQLRTACKGGPPTWLGEELTTHHKKPACYEMLHGALECRVVGIKMPLLHNSISMKLKMNYYLWISCRLPNSLICIFLSQQCIRHWLRTESVCPICRSFTRMVDEFPPLS
jgi:hypothetical protein